MRIVAGNFSTKAKADSAIRTLVSGGIDAHRIHSAFEIGVGKKGTVEAIVDSVTDAVGEMVDKAMAEPDDTVVGARAPGVHVSVEAAASTDRAYAASVLRDSGASDVDEADSTWVDGRWEKLAETQAGEAPGS